MAELDSLIGCKISLISHQDIRYDGTLFSINQNESSIALKDVQVFGTEDRVTDAAKKVAPSTAMIPFVTFPGSEIKDLFVHEAASATTDATATAATSAPPAAPTAATKVDNRSRPSRESKPRVDSVAPPQPPREDRGKQGQYRERREQQPQAVAAQAQPAPAVAVPPPAPQTTTQNQSKSVVGTGSHLLKLRERKASGAHEPTIDATQGDFDFEEGIKTFNKDDIVQDGGNTQDGKKYLKDDFFDNLSNDVTEKEVGRKTRLTASEERQLNQDTFGAIALQSNYRRGGGRGGRGGGRGGSYGRGRGYYGNGGNGGSNNGGQGQGQGRGGGGYGGRGRYSNKEL